MRRCETQQNFYVLSGARMSSSEELVEHIGRIVLCCVQTVSGFVDKINAAGGNAKVFVYPGEGHAFMNAGEKIKEKMKSEGLFIFEILHLQTLAVGSYLYPG